jgi:hypothetical protein
MIGTVMLIQPLIKLTEGMEVIKIDMNNIPDLNFAK